LIGAIELLWRFGTAIGNFAGSFVFSPKVWAGIIVVIVSVVLFAVAGRLRARGRRRVGAQDASRAAGTGASPAVTGGKQTKAVSASKRQANGLDDDDLGDVAEILRRRGIR
jgi:hypothetical protein